MDITFDKVDHIHIYVTDREKSEKWYADVLGMQRIKAYEFWAEDGGPLTIANGDVHLALFVGSEANNNAVAIDVNKSDFVKMQAHLKQQNVAFEFQDHDLSHSIYFTDPDGNEYEITTYEI